MERKRFNNLLSKISDDNDEEDDQKVIDSFELSSRIAIKHSLLMFQYMNYHQASGNGASNQQSSTSSGVLNSEPNNSITLNSLNNGDDNLDLINPLYEIALQKAPLLYIKRGYELNFCSLIRIVS